LTQEERVQRNLQEAERKGDVIIMLDSDGEDNATPHQKKAATKKPSSAERSHASSTKQALGLDGIGDEPLISLKTTTKRTRLQYARGLDAETTKRRPGDSTYAIQNSPLATQWWIQRHAQEEPIQRNFQEAPTINDNNNRNRPQRRPKHAAIQGLQLPHYEEGRPFSHYMDPEETRARERTATKKPSAKRSHASSTKQALGLDGIGDEPLISLKTTTKRTRIEGDESLVSLKTTQRYAQEERIQRNFQEAKNKGRVILILDSDDEDNTTPQKMATTMTPSSSQRSHDMLESVSNTRDIPENPLETPGPSTKQALGLGGEGDEPLISSETTTKRTRDERDHVVLTRNQEKRELATLHM
jgi:hypothetical protein